MASTKPPALLGATAFKPVERHGWEAIRYFFHNPDTGEIMTRTPLSWLLITVFYVIYYSCLAAFWATCWAVFMQTQINDDRPKWLNTNGPIGESPGLGLRPRQPNNRIRDSIIQINVGQLDGVDDDIHWKAWKNRVDNFLAPYRIKNDTNLINIKDLEECGLSNTDYGYKSGTPCVYLKLNRIYGVKNKPFNQTNLPNDMPKDLKENISRASDQDKVWISCKETSNRGKNKYVKMIEYFPPNQGISNKLYSATNKESKPEKSYLSPLIALKIHPIVTNGKLKIFEEDVPIIEIECRAWAENIVYDSLDRTGMIDIKMQFENKTSP